jgi:hypothetical protein
VAAQRVRRNHCCIGDAWFPRLGAALVAKRVGLTRARE